MALPMLDIESVGAGGGSIAWVDDQRRLNVGPQSAGAHVRAPRATAAAGPSRRSPTPTSCSASSTPRSTSAAACELDADLAREAVGRLAEQLGLEPDGDRGRHLDRRRRQDGRPRPADERAARASTRGASRARRSAAAGRCIRAAVAAQAGIRTADRPAAAGRLGLVGVRRRHLGRRRTSSSAGACCAAGRRRRRRGGLRRARGRTRRTTLARQGVSPDNGRLVRSVRMRYSMQIHDVEVPVAAGAIDDAASPSSTGLRAHPRRALRQGLRLSCRRRGLHGVPGAGHGPHHEAVARGRHGRPALGVLALDLLAASSARRSRRRPTTLFPPTPSRGPR